MMRPVLRIQDDLLHIAEAIERIESYTANIDQGAFMADAKTQDAIIRNFEFNVDLEQVWQAIQNDLPTFRAGIDTLLKNLPGA